MYTCGTVCTTYGAGTGRTSPSAMNPPPTAAVTSTATYSHSLRRRAGRSSAAGSTLVLVNPNPRSRSLESSRGTRRGPVGVRTTSPIVGVETSRQRRPKVGSATVGDLDFSRATTRRVGSGSWLASACGRLGCLCGVAGPAADLHTVLDGERDADVPVGGVANVGEVVAQCGEVDVVGYHQCAGV